MQMNYAFCVLNIENRALPDPRRQVYSGMTGALTSGDIGILFTVYIILPQTGFVDGISPKSACPLGWA